MRRGLGTAFLVMLVLDTIGAVAGADKSRAFLPPPRMYLATWILYAILGAAASIGPRVARYANRLGWLIVLTALLGKYGRLLIRVLEAAANTVAHPQADIPPSASSVGGAAAVIQQKIG